MSDLRTQLRRYLDETSEPITPDDVYNTPVGEGKVRPLTRFPVRGRIPAGVLVAVTAAVVAVLVVGVPLLINGLSESTPADDVASTTAAPESSTTTVAPSTTTTIVVESAPTTIQQVTVDVVSSIVPGLGTLTWERIEGDETSLPQGIHDYRDGVYVAYDAGGQWTSPDAVTWTLQDGTIDGYRWFYEEGGWAVGSNMDHSELLRREDDGWVVVDLSTDSLPEVEGVTWRSHARIPVESGGVLVTDASAWGEIAWGDVFGTFEVDCGEPEPCEMQPYGMWDAYSQTVRIENPHNGMVLAQAEIVVEGDEVQFVDQKSGEVIHTLLGGPDYPADRILDQIQRDGGGLFISGGYVSDDGGETWSWVLFPWQSHAEVSVLPDGGFAAFEFDYRWQENPENPLTGARVWTSVDGRTWTDQGDPGFAIDGVQHVNVIATDVRLIATAITGHDPQTGMEEGVTYVSTNALDWETVDLPFPAWFDEAETNFGSVITSMPQSRHFFWVSTDGGSVWHEVEGPPGSHEPTGPGGGYGGAGAAGDILFVVFGSEPEGPRTLWIGRFVP